MTDTDLKPCPNPWCSHTNGLYVVWDLYSRRVCCRCGVKGPMSETKANTTQGVPINDGVRKQAEKEAVAAWNTRPSPTREEIAVKPLEWDGLVSGPYEIRIEEGGIADLYFYGERDEDGNPVLLQGAYLTLIDLDEFKEIAQKHHAEQMAKLVNVTPSPVAGWRGMESAPKDGTSILTHPHWRITHWTDTECLTDDGSGWAGSWDDYVEGFSAITPTHWMPLPPAPGQQPATEQPSDPWAFNEPYSLKREETALSGTVFWLMSNGVSIASYAVRNWGSEDACIKAAWRHAYEPEQPSVAEAARVLLENTTISEKKAMNEAAMQVMHPCGWELSDKIRFDAGRIASLRTLQGDG